MEYENMRVAELNALAREGGLKGYSRMRKYALLNLIRDWEVQEGPRHAERQPTRPNQTQSVRFRPTQQEMDIFEQQEMSKSRPQVKSKLNDWYDRLINHVPKTVKDGASRAFKTFKDKIMGLYNGITGSTANQTQLKGHQSREPEPFNPIELEQAFNGAYRSYKV